MTKQSLINRTIKAIEQLPETQAVAVTELAERRFRQHEERQLLAEIQQLVAESETFAFLEGDEELYAAADAKSHS